jgi:hypothetical protein
MPEWVLHFRVDGSVDRRRYNAPTAADVAGFMPGGCMPCAELWGTAWNEPLSRPHSHAAETLIAQQSIPWHNHCCMPVCVCR